MKRQIVSLIVILFVIVNIFSVTCLPTSAMADDAQALAGIWKGSYDLSGEGLVLSICLTFSENNSLEINEELLGEQYTQQGTYSADSGNLRMIGAHIEWVYDKEIAEYSYSLQGDTLC